MTKTDRGEELERLRQATEALITAAEAMFPAHPEDGTYRRLRDAIDQTREALTPIAARVCVYCGEAGRLDDPLGHESRAPVVRARCAGKNVTSADLRALVDRLRALEVEATPGPWSAQSIGYGTWELLLGGDSVSFALGSNCHLVQALRNALPALLDAAEELLKRRAASSLGGSRGGVARASKLTPEQRREIAKKGSDARWRKSP